MKKYIALTLVIFFILALSFGWKKINDKNAANSQAGNKISQSVNPYAPPKTPAKHVVIVMEENQDYSKIIGNTQDLPYLNSLASQYAYAKNYYANVHPSMGNYFMLTAGQVFSKDDGYSQEVKDDNIVRQMISQGKTWKEYSENLPSIGYTGGDVNGYTQHHNPLSYYSDVRENSEQLKNLVPFSQFATDLANNQLPDFSFVVPNNSDNAHSCPASGGCSNAEKLQSLDNWLKTNIDPLMKNSDFNSPGGGILIVTFDEGNKSDKENGGGHTALVMAGPDVKKGYTSGTFYQEENALRFISEEIGLSSFPGKAQNAQSMQEFMMGN